MEERGYREVRFPVDAGIILLLEILFFLSSLWLRSPFAFLGRLVSRCFKPSRPQRIVSGLREAFIKRSIVERTSKADIRPEEQSEKAESCREILWNEIQLKRPLLNVKNINRNIPTM